jgi:5-(carboxyamino)imidazole ribonucleotide synthase
MGAEVTSGGRPLPPGSTIGILGGGQLGRMIALAAARLGLKSHIYSDEAGPAFDVAAATTVGDYGDRDALQRFAKRIDVATYEFENVPVDAARHLEQFVPVRPGARALEVAQDRLAEKKLARSLGAGTAAFAAIDTLDELSAALAGAVPVPAVLKTRRFGYDGKGQIKIASDHDAAAAWQAIGGRPAILESFVPFTREVSVVATRDGAGAFAAFDVTENEHRDHILHRSIAPARLSAGASDQAMQITRRIADAVAYVGVLAIEFFVVDARGGREMLIVNEMAPRVHNSGHWTIEGAATSQFEQHVRAVAGWPLGATRRLAPRVEMVNLIGAEALDWHRLAAEPGLAVHLYGKREARAGRKMGHVTRLLER